MGEKLMTYFQIPDNVRFHDIQVTVGEDTLGDRLCYYYDGVGAPFLYETCQPEALLGTRVMVKIVKSLNDEKNILNICEVEIYARNV